MRASIVIAAAMLVMACRHDIRIAQRTDGEVPGMSGVRLHVGDLSVGVVPLRVSGSDGSLLAAGELWGAEELPFFHDGQPYVVTIVEIEDHNLHEDVAELRVEQRSSPNVLRLARDATGESTEYPGTRVRVTAMTTGKEATLDIATPTAAIPPTVGLAPGQSNQLEYHGTSIEVVVFGFEDRPADADDRVYVRVRRGKR